MGVTISVAILMVLAAVERFQRSQTKSNKQSLNGVEDKDDKTLQNKMKKI